MPIGTTLAIIASIAGLAGTGIGVGETLANQPGGGPPKPTAPPPPTPAQIGTEQNQERALISQSAPNVLSQTSGLANPDYVAQIAQLLAGTGGQTGSTGAARQTVQQLFGLPGLPSAGSGTQFTPAGATSGSTGPAPPATDTKLADFVNQFIYA